MDELREQFLIEGRELVQAASDDLLALEQNGADPVRIDNVLRAFHTLKGSAALFDFAPMTQVFHAAESLLGVVRDGGLNCGRAAIGVLLDCIGAADRWLDAIAQTDELPSDAASTAQRLEATLNDVLHAAPEQETTGVLTPTDWLAAARERHAAAIAVAREAGRSVIALRYVPNSDCFFQGDDPLARLRKIPDLIALHVEERETWTRATLDPFSCNLTFEALSTAPFDVISSIFPGVGQQISIREVVPQPIGAGDAQGARVGETVTPRVLRVDAGRIDALVDIVGELIVAKNGLAHLAGRVEAADLGLGRALRANQADLDRLIGSMHRAIMAVRMTPLAQTFRRLPRLARDIADRLGKQLRFEISGEEVEADKSIVDGLFEPLLHILRNAIDHGIENPDVRAELGKPASGHIRLEGRRQGDQIVISVADDGPGLDLERVRRAAKARNVMSAAALDTLDDSAVAGLIFTPGLSTAAKVTEVSGRGVGMDSVRAAVEALGGRIAVASVSGVGSTISLTMPQTALVTTVMMVSVGDERFGVPIDVVAEIVRISASRIFPIRSGEAFVLRDRTTPLLRLPALLGQGTAPRPASAAATVIVLNGDQRIGLEVDAVGERFDILMRPMTGMLSGMTGLLGTALLGDGQVLVVLDLLDLVQ